MSLFGPLAPARLRPPSRYVNNSQKTVRKFWAGSLCNQARVLCATSGSGGSREAEGLAQDQRIWGGGQLCEDHLWRSVPPSTWIFSFTSSPQLCSRVCSASQVRWLVVPAKSSLPRRTWTASSWVEPPSSQSLLTLSTPRHKNWPLATSETTFRAFSFSPSLSVLPFFLVTSTCAMMPFPYSPLFTPLAYLVILQRDKLTHSLYCTETRVCPNCHTKCSIVLAVSLRLYLKSLQKALWTVSRLLSIKSILFLFNNTGVSLCNYDVQWLLTPCRCAPPPLAGCLAKREVSFHVIGLKDERWECCKKTT